MAAARAARVADMSPSTPRHTARARDRAIRRLRRITASVAVGGASAVGLIGWGLAASAHTTAAATTTSSSAPAATASSPTSSASASPTAAASSQPASSPTSSNAPAHAVTGGSGHG